MRHMITLASLVFLVGCGDVEGMQNLRQSEIETTTEVVYLPCTSEETDAGVLITCPDDEEPSLVRHGRAGRDGVDGKNGQDGVDGETVEVTHTERVVEHTTETVREVEVDNDPHLYLNDGTRLGVLMWVDSSDLFVELPDMNIIGVSTTTAIPHPVLFWDSTDCTGEPIAMAHYNTRGQYSTVMFDGANGVWLERGERLETVNYNSMQIMSGTSNGCHMEIGGRTINANVPVEYHGLDDVTFEFNTRVYVHK